MRNCKKLSLVVLVVFLVSMFTSTAALAGVMMQGFYWDVPAGGKWYNTMKSKAYELRYMVDGYGIDRIWFPPSKAKVAAIPWVMILRTIMTWGNITNMGPRKPGLVLKLN